MMRIPPWNQFINFFIENFRQDTPPSPVNELRITDDGDTRITDDGDDRIVDPF